ncbi:MAG: DUF7121 family protein [Thermoplasmatota archaeon]
MAPNESRSGGRGFGFEPEDEEVQGVKTQIVGAEKQYRRMLDRREERNAAARELRSERDAINEKKRGILDEMRKLAQERDEWNTKARGHREKRNAAQQEAKGLIEMRRKARSGTVGFAGKARDLEGQIKALEFQQQTTSLTIAQENALLKKVAEMRKELSTAKGEAQRENEVLAGVTDMGERIDLLFKLADSEHKEAVAAMEEAQKLHERIEPLVKELRFLDQQSDAKHAAYLAAKADADAIHQRMVESREKVVGLRGERARIEEERKQIIDQQNRSARESLSDEVGLEKAADEAVQLLLAKGKVKVGAPPRE